MRAAGLVLLYLGVIVSIVAVIGLFRFKDPYSRVKALSLTNFPGAVLIHIASSLVLVPFAKGGIKGLITALLFILSGPVVSHVILLAAHQTGVPRSFEVDELKSMDGRKDWDGTEPGEGV